jgi:hypothetical protein
VWAADSDRLAADARVIPKLRYREDVWRCWTCCLAQDMLYGVGADGLDVEIDTARSKRPAGARNLRRSAQ